MRNLVLTNVYKENDLILHHPRSKSWNYWKNDIILDSPQFYSLKFWNENVKVLSVIQINKKQNTKNSAKSKKYQPYKQALLGSHPQPKSYPSRPVC